MWRDFDQVIAERKLSAKASLRPASFSEVESLVDELSAKHPAHPWLETFRDFVKEREAESIFRGATGDGFHFVFYPIARQGIWLVPEDGSSTIGILGETAKRVLYELLE